MDKSHREHRITGTHPDLVRKEADNAVASEGFSGSYYVDADPIQLATIDSFIHSSDFFTLDVADAIGKKPDDSQLETFINRHSHYLGKLTIPGIERNFLIDESMLREIGYKYVSAIVEAGKLYRYIEERKGEGNFITEISMDETDQPQPPIELFFILSAVSMEGIHCRTIAPKFTGRFNKGVEYIGDIHLFAKQFEEDINVIAFAGQEWDIQSNLKLSIHSGSDKFSLYPIIRQQIEKHNAGIHVKTAGTTWLAELIGTGRIRRPWFTLC